MFPGRGGLEPQHHAKQFGACTVAIRVTGQSIPFAFGKPKSQIMLITGEEPHIHKFTFRSQN